MVCENCGRYLSQRQIWSNSCLAEFIQDQIDPLKPSNTDESCQALYPEAIYANIAEYIEDIFTMPSKPSFALVGNKLDLVDVNAIDLSSIKAVAETHGVSVYLTSAKENIMIQEMFVDMVKKAMKLN